MDVHVIVDGKPYPVNFTGQHNLALPASDRHDVLRQPFASRNNPTKPGIPNYPHGEATAKIFNGLGQRLANLVSQLHAEDTQASSNDKLDAHHDPFEAHHEQDAPSVIDKLHRLAKTPVSSGRSNPAPSNLRNELVAISPLLGGLMDEYATAWNKTESRGNSPVYFQEDLRDIVNTIRYREMDVRPASMANDRGI